MKSPKFLKSKRNRLLFFGSILITCVVATIYFATNNETYPKSLLTSLNNYLPETISKLILIGFPVIVSILVVGVSNEIFSGDLHDWLKGEEESQVLTNNFEPDIKLFFDSLKQRYQKRYHSKLDGRFEITLEVNKDWNFNQPQTYKVNYRDNKNIDEAFKSINESFERQGRLLIVGSRGSGKTVLLLKLALELLGDECKAEQQIPVIFNLASWSEDYANFEDWLIDVLNAGNGLSKDFAQTLLEQNRIIFLLDGLDELARNEETEIANSKRAKCLDSLNDYLRMGRKTVICCRREEFAEMQKATNQDAPVSAKVEVLDLRKPEIILALQHAQRDTKSNASATNLLKIVETNDVFLDVLSTPFYFTTALEVFDRQLLNEIDFPTDEAEIKHYLLNRFIESKLQHSSRLTEYEKDKAKFLKWFSWLAKLMEKKQLVSFELADLQPTDLMKSKTVVRLNGVLISGLLPTVKNFERFNPQIIYPDESTHLNFSKIFTNDFWEEVPNLFARVLLMALIISLIFSYLEESYYSTLESLVNIMSFFFFFWMSGSLERLKDFSKFAQLNKPYQRLMGGAYLSIRISIFILLLLYPLWLFFSYINLRNYFAVPILINVFVFFVLFYLIRIVILRHFFLRFYLWREGSTPLKYATFLDLAAEARILEKDGGHWRFRHQTLQEHFAKMEV